MLAKAAIPNELRVSTFNAAAVLNHGRPAIDTREYSPGSVQLKAGTKTE
jgi:hypothetical protein